MVRFSPFWLGGRSPFWSFTHGEHMNKNDIKNISNAISSKIYTPSNVEVRMKSAFWAKWTNHPSYVSGDIPANLAMIVNVLGNSTIEKYWSKEGFRDWFLNSDEYIQRVEYLATRALDVVEGVLAGGEGIKASDQLKAASMMMEAAGKLNKKKAEVRYLDASLDKMDAKELEAYIAKLES